jgi:PAS domain S-box-containing protein
MGSNGHQTQKTSSSSLYLALVPVLLFLILIAVLYLLSRNLSFARFVFEPPLLLPLLNTVFLFIVGCIVSYVAMKAYQVSGSSTTLLLGCGVLTLGTGALLAGWLIGPGGPNVTATVFNVAALVASILHVIAAITDFTEKPRETDQKHKQRKLLLSYLSVILFVIILSILSDTGITPPFFIQGTGPTTLRQVVLATALIFYLIASSYMMSRFFLKRVQFFYWYSLALLLVAINMAGTYFQPAVGSLLGWASRFAVYLAGIYFFIAVFSTSREARKQKTSLDETVAELFRKSEEKLSSILASITDCHFELDKDWRFIRINDQSLAYFNREREELIGQSYFEVFPTLKGSILEEQYLKVVSKSTSAHFDVESRLYPGRWVELHVYPTEERGVSIFFRDITEHKQKEELIRKSEEKFRAIADYTYGWENWIGPDGKLTWINPGVSRVSGYSPEECMAMDNFPLPLVYEPDRDRMEKLFQEAVQGSSGNDIEFRISCKDGSIRWTAISWQPIYDEEGINRGHRSSIRDITQRKRVEEDLRRAEEYLRFSLETIHTGAWDLNLVDHTAFRSLEHDRIFGYDQLLPAWTYEIFLQHVLPEDRAMVDNSFQKAMEDQSDWNFECRILRKDGQVCWIWAAGRHTQDVEGVPRHMAGIVQDITERKQAAEALRKAHDELEERVKERTAELRESEETARARQREIETYYSMMPIGLCILDRELRYVRVNERLAEINALPVSAHLGRMIREVMPSIADQAEELASRVVESGESFANIEFSGETIQRPGIQRVCRASWFPLKDTSGEVISIGLMVEDITEQRRLEDRLRQAQKMEAIGTLAGGIAHDFNNILAAIIGFAEMVEEDLPSDSPSIRRIRRVLSAAWRGKELVKQILAFSRKTEPVRKPLSLSPVIKETVQLLRASLPSTIEIELHLKASRDTVLATPQEFQQILMNLATNASFAMRGTGGTLSITTRDTDFEPDLPVLNTDVEPGEYIQIVVTDTGHGMEHHVMERVFEPFFTTKGIGEGTGMGLAVVYGIVKSLHGTIAVESEPGAGSTFRVFLPMARLHENRESIEIRTTFTGKEHILFVDDEEMLREWGQAALERLGYTVTALTDSGEALNLFSSDPSRFNIVITDQTMPKLSGLHLAQRILAVRNDIPIILCTGHSDSVSPEKAREAGIKEFLIKPIGKQALAEVVRRILDANGSKD